MRRPVKTARQRAKGKGKAAAPLGPCLAGLTAFRRGALRHNQRFLGSASACLFFHRFSRLEAWLSAARLR